MGQVDKEQLASSNEAWLFVGRFLVEYCQRLKKKNWLKMLLANVPLIQLSRSGLSLLILIGEGRLS